MMVGWHIHVKETRTLEKQPELGFWLLLHALPAVKVTEDNNAGTFFRSGLLRNSD